MMNTSKKIEFFCINMEEKVRKRVEINSDATLLFSSSFSNLAYEMKAEEPEEIRRHWDSVRRGWRDA